MHNNCVTDEQNTKDQTIINEYLRQYPESHIQVNVATFA